MPNDLLAVERIGALLLSFSAVLARTSAALAFLPLPYLRQAPAPLRALAALGMAGILFGARAGTLAGAAPDPATLAGEIVLGAAVGSAVAWLTEIVVLAAQMAASQSGFGLASMIDPATQADSTVLQSLGQLTAGLLFVAVGADVALLRVLATSFDLCPPGSWTPPKDAIPLMLGWSAAAFDLAVRLALPSIAVLGAADLVLGLAGRMNPSLQLLSLAFPAKALAGIVLTAWLAGAQGSLFSAAARRAFEICAALHGAGR